ncbi:MAG TPA: hypothetical protein VM845_03410 [Burkholderiaceae bacterium]|jgi:hypothetical protein|nr:hypothetical protein [Burkholderiaceae bacterium]
MSTRYSLPRDVPQTDTARGARVLASIVLVATVTALSLLAVILPATESSVATAPDSDAAPPPVVTGA